MKPIKQTVYLPVKVEDEFPNGECVMISKTHDMLVGYPADVDGETQADDEHQNLRYITHWLKKQEGYFFTPEQLNEYTQRVIKQTLENAAEKVKMRVQPSDMEEWENVPDEITREDVDDEESGCENFWISVSKESITNTLDETFKQFKV